MNISAVTHILKFVAIFIAVFIAIQAKSRYIGVNIGVYFGILFLSYQIFDDEYRKNYEYFRRYPHILEHTRRKNHSRKSALQAGSAEAGK